MAIKILSSPSKVEYTFPSAENLTAGWRGGFESLFSDLRFRAEATSSCHSAGGMMTGDCLADVRQIPIHGVLCGPERASFRLAVDQLLSACYRCNHSHQDRLLELTQYPGQYYRIGGFRRISIDWTSDRSAEIMLEVELADPHRYDKVETRFPPVGGAAVQRVLSASNNFTATWEVDLPDNIAFIQPPRLIVTIWAGGLDQFIFRNFSGLRPSGDPTAMRLTGLQISASDTGDLNSIRIDSTAGTVHLCSASEDGAVDWSTRVNYTHKFVSGDFPWLQPGRNTLQFIGGPMAPGQDIGLRFFLFVRKRYL